MRIYFFLIYFILFGYANINGQSSSKDLEIAPSLHQKYLSALEYLELFKVDSADFILDEIIAEIKDSEIENSPFGLRVLSRKAEALERDNEGDLALLAFQDVKEKAIKANVWDVVVHASINLALVYEKVGKNNDCLQNLRMAQRTIKNHPELDYLYPFFCVRISSYHRIYASRDSAIYYANECIRTYKKYDDFNQAADAYMLKTLLSKEEGIDIQIKNAKKAVEIFKKIGNHSGNSYMLFGISKLYHQNGKFDKSLMYNDSSIWEAKKSIDEGFDVYHALYIAYKYRGEIFKSMEQHDSSSFYIKKGYELQSQHIQEESNNKVLAMDAKYKDDQKALKIKEQEKLLKSVTIQRRLLLIIFGLVTLFTFGLFYYYNKLRKAKQQTEIQAAQIRKTNQELSKSLNRQIILQGEVHHRVKNNLQVIISLLDLQKDELEDEEAKKYIDSMSKRIYSMAAIHNLLYQKEDMEFIQLSDYIENLCYHFSNFSIKENKPEFSLHVEDIELNLETSMPIGIIITELLTNSLKYARIEGQTLKVAVEIKRKDNGVFIRYKDNGPGFDSGKRKTKSTGIGFYILESMTRQLQGELKRKNDNGAAYEIFIVEKNRRNE